MIEMNLKLGFQEEEEERCIIQYEYGVIQSMIEIEVYGSKIRCKK